MSMFQVGACCNQPIVIKIKHFKVSPISLCHLMFSTAQGLVLSNVHTHLVVLAYMHISEQWKLKWFDVPLRLNSFTSTSSRYPQPQITSFELLFS